MMLRNVRAHLTRVVPLMFLTAAGVLAAGHSGPMSNWGNDSANQVSDAPAGDFSELARGGAYQGLAIRDDGTLTLWGGFGDPFAVPPVPAELATQHFVAVALARSHAMAIRPDGSVASWGANNSSGQLTPPPGVRFAAVAGGIRPQHRTLDGRVPERLGREYRRAERGKFEAIAARVNYSLGLRHDGTLFGWGSSLTGIFDQWTLDGLGHYYVAGEKFDAVAAGNLHALAIRHNGTVVGWGNNSGGALNPPGHVRFKDVAVGFGYSVGLDTEGTLWGWGDPSTAGSPAPWTFEAAGWTRYDAGQYYVPGEKFRSVATAAFHVYAIEK